MAITVKSLGKSTLPTTEGDLYTTPSGKAAIVKSIRLVNTGSANATVNFDGTTTVLGLVPASNVYTLNRSIFCTDITVNSGVTVKTAGFKIFCTRTLTNNGTITGGGGNGTAGAAAGSAGAAGTAVTAA